MHVPSSNAADGQFDESPRTIFVAGATGRSGVQIVKEATRYGLKVKAGVRSLSKADSMGLTSMYGVEVVQMDVVNDSEEELGEKLEGVYGVIDAAGYVPTYAPSLDRALSHEIDNVGACKLVRAAGRLHHPPRFVLVSSLLTNSPNSASYKVLNSLGNVLKEKREAESFLQQSSLDFVILRPGVFASKPQGSIILAGEDTFDGDNDLLYGAPVKCTSPFMAGINNTVCGVTRVQLAQVAVAAVLDKDLHEVIVEIVARPQSSMGTAVPEMLSAFHK